MEKVYLVEWIEDSEYEVYSDFGKAMSKILEKYTKWAEGLEGHEILRDLKDIVTSRYIEDFVYICEKEVK